MTFTTLAGDGNDIAIDAVLDGTIDALYIYADQACAPCACVRVLRAQSDARACPTPRS